MRDQDFHQARALHFTDKKQIYLFTNYVAGDNLLNKDFKALIQSLPFSDKIKLAGEIAYAFNTIHQDTASTGKAKFHADVKEDNMKINLRTPFKLLSVLPNDPQPDSYILIKNSDSAQNWQFYYINENKEIISLPLFESESNNNINNNLLLNSKDSNLKNSNLEDFYLKDIALALNNLSDINKIPENYSPYETQTLEKAIVLYRINVQKKSPVFDVTILDYGLAQAVDESAPNSFDKFVTPGRGTRGYIAPEMANDQGGTKSDMLAIAGIFSTLFGARNPRKEKTHNINAPYNLENIFEEDYKNDDKFHALIEYLKDLQDNKQIDFNLTDFLLEFIDTLQDPDYNQRPDINQLMWFLNILRQLYYQYEEAYDSLDSESEKDEKILAFEQALPNYFAKFFIFLNYTEMLSNDEIFSSVIRDDTICQAFYQIAKYNLPIYDVLIAYYKEAVSEQPAGGTMTGRIICFYNLLSFNKNSANEYLNQFDNAELIKFFYSLKDHKAVFTKHFGSDAYQKLEETLADCCYNKIIQIFKNKKLLSTQEIRANTDHINKHMLSLIKEMPNKNPQNFFINIFEEINMNKNNNTAVQAIFLYMLPEKINYSHINMLSIPEKLALHDYINNECTFISHNTKEKLITDLNQMLVQKVTTYIQTLDTQKPPNFIQKIFGKPSIERQKKAFDLLKNAVTDNHNIPNFFASENQKYRKALKYAKKGESRDTTRELISHLEKFSPKKIKNL